MLQLHPFTGHVVAADRAHRVVAPPYDALDPAARAALAATDPDSYLGALPPDASVDPGQLDTVLSGCRAHLDQLLAAGRYRPLPGPAIGVLALGSGRHRAVAVVGDVPVTAFTALTGSGTTGPFTADDGQVRPHEQVHEDRVADLARYLEVVGVASSPVALTQRPAADVTAATATVLDDTPDLAYRADDGVDVALWTVTDPVRCAHLTAAIAAAGPAYLADGHHRGAAASRFAASTGASADEAAGRILCAVLPSDHLEVHPFHRRVEDVLPASRQDAEAAVAALLDRLRHRGVQVTAADGPRTPSGPHRVSLTATGRWWELDLTDQVRTDDVVEALDVRLVEREVLTAVTPEDGRATTVTPVPAPLGLEALMVDRAVGLALYPPDVASILAVADAGRCVPPKTTYVTPKLRSGLIVTPRARPVAPGSP